jgi:glycosyltransferase involved in cell wall biosynthesis
MHLGACLDALSSNDLRKTEVLVVDDGSTDGTASLAESFTSLEIKVERVGGLGPAAARNRGAEVSGHPFILFLDADIVLPDRAIYYLRETLALYSHREDVAGVLGTYSEEIPTKDFVSNFKNLSTCYLYRITETQSPFIHTPVFMVAKEVLRSVGGFDESLRRGEDFRLGVSLGSRGFCFIIDRRIRAVHLKSYSLLGVLWEDWARVQDLSRIRLQGSEKTFALRAHRPTRLLSLFLPGPLLLAVVAATLGWLSVWVPLILFLTFLFLNLRFLSYLRRKRGWLFAARSLLFHILEMLWAACALVVGTLRRKH